MSRTAPRSGFGPLEAFFDAEEGVSFKADNGHFLCSIRKDDDFTCIEAVQNKDRFCKFLVENLDNETGKVRLRDGRGCYLRRTERHGRHPITAPQLGGTYSDRSHEFLVCSRNGKVIFQADNGLFLSRIYWLGSDEHILEAAKPDADEFCEFVPDIGDLIRPTFEVISLECDTPRKKRVEVNAKEYVNKSSIPENYTFRLTWEKRVTEMTTWTRAWGLNTVVSVDTDRFGASLGVTLWYDGVHGKKISKEKLISEAEEVSVTVPPGTKMTAKLIANVNEDAEITFTAKIKKVKVTGESERLTARGTWNGVVYDLVGLEIEEKKL